STSAGRRGGRCVGVPPRLSAKGLIQQGWKDSWDSVSHEDGALAAPPIALCEVQGYAYAAKCAGATIALALGQVEKSQALLIQAEKLKNNFHKRFWSEELSTYVLALDGQKRQCRVKASNAGHCLYTGIVDKRYARTVAQDRESVGE